jgi:nucleoside-diphosphate-sugar epimerase
MNKEAVLITGANGEIGHGLIQYLGEQSRRSIIAIDLQPLDNYLKPFVNHFIQGDILDDPMLDNLGSKHQIVSIFHLASILSTKAEENPELAHKVNVDGSMNLFKLAINQLQQNSNRVKFIYPSSIAVYGMCDLDTKRGAAKVNESKYCDPTTMYGINKLYCENLGKYFSEHYNQLGMNTSHHAIDFRCLRFPGLISAQTIPAGGTSDYGPEMLHYAAQGKKYPCFVRPDSKLPFMVMPDAIKSLLALEAAPETNLKQRIYNVTSFSPSAQEFADAVKKSFPTAEIIFEPHPARQGIVDSWPEDIDDSAARRDWQWKPDYDMQRAFEDYLIPAIKERYNIK